MHYSNFFLPFHLIKTPKLSLCCIWEHNIFSSQNGCFSKAFCWNHFAWHFEYLLLSLMSWYLIILKFNIRSFWDFWNKLLISRLLIEEDPVSPRPPAYKALRLLLLMRIILNCVCEVIYNTALRVSRIVQSVEVWLHTRSRGLRDYENL